MMNFCALNRMARLRLHLAVVLAVVHAVEQCPTPSGWHPCDCVREVASGTIAEEVHGGRGGGRVLRLRHPNGTVEDVPECPHARPPRPTPGGAAPADPCALDWAHAAPMEVFSQHNKSITTFTANYVVMLRRFFKIIPSSDCADPPGPRRARGHRR